MSVSCWLILFVFSGSVVGSLRLHAPRKSRGLGFVKGARREAAAGPSGCQVAMRHTESFRIAEEVEGQNWRGNLTIHRGVRCRKACVPGVMGRPVIGPVFTACPCSRQAHGKTRNKTLSQPE